MRIYKVSIWGGENAKFFPTKREAMKASRKLTKLDVPHKVIKVIVPRPKKDLIVAIANGEDWISERETLVGE